MVEGTIKRHFLWGRPSGSCCLSLLTSFRWLQGSEAQASAWKTSGVESRDMPRRFHRQDSLESQCSVTPSPTPLSLGHGNRQIGRAMPMPPRSPYRVWPSCLRAKSTCVLVWGTLVARAGPGLQSAEWREGALGHPTSTCPLCSKSLHLGVSWSESAEPSGENRLACFP